MIEPTGTGLRFNEGKLRYDLVDAWAHEQMVKVLTYGSNKYSDRNWEAGMPWSKIISSLKRHLAGIEKGEDYDPETGELHAAHLACNAHFLTAYYKLYPQGDDRPHNYLRRPKIGLDIDEVLADWVGHWTKYHGQVTPEFWNFDKDIKNKFLELKDNKDFWLSIPTKTSPKDLPFEPHCYITSRSIPQEWTEEWIQANGFPTMPVYTIPHGVSKVDVAKTSGIDIFVDDRYENFVELNRAGICCFLFDAPHNTRYDVGYRRLYNLKDLVSW
jgi:5'(3')-deoxyribonucleotidase